MVNIPLYLYQGYALPRPESLYDYVLDQAGVVKRVESRYASADKCLITFPETNRESLTGLQLARYPLEPVQPKFPRIPGRLLLDLLADARQNLSREVMYHLRYHPTTGWRVTRPDQRGHWSRVGYDEQDQHDIMLEIHSHNTLPAFFSTTDDRDEQGGRFYGVIGKLDQERPQLVLRLGLYGHWIPNIPGLTLFDDLGPCEEVYLDPPVVAEPEPRRSFEPFTHFFRRRGDR